MEPTPDFFESHNDSEDNTLLKLKGLLYSSIRENKRSFTIICLLTVIGMIADASIPFIFKTTIDDGINGKNIDLVLLLIWGQFFIFLGNYLSNSVSSVVLTKLGLNLSFNLMSNYLKTIVLLPMRFFDCKVNSDLIQKIDDQNIL